jgi:hypothetical protein
VNLLIAAQLFCALHVAKCIVSAATKEHNMENEVYKCASEMEKEAFDY